MVKKVVKPISGWAIGEVRDQRNLVVFELSTAEEKQTFVIPIEEAVRFARDLLT